MYTMHKYILIYSKSIGIYLLSEGIHFGLTGNYDNAPKRILFGSFVDSVLMRKFHTYIDTKAISSVQKMILEQVTIAPLVGSGFLLLHNNFSVYNLKDIFMDDCKFWPFASFLGYRFVSTNHRYLYNGFASVIWNNYRILNYTDN